MLKAFFARSRLLVLLAVGGSFLAATAMLVYASCEVVVVLAHTVRSGAISTEGGKTLALACIEIVDLYLLGTFFYIVALGLYELFIDASVPLPRWLEIRDLDDLKNKLVRVVVVVLAVTFLGQVVVWDGERNLLGFGVAIGAVIAALSWFLAQKAKQGA